MAGLEAVVFDLDGTLVDSRQHILNYNRDLFAAVNLPFPENEAEAFLTLDRVALERRFFGQVDRPDVVEFRRRARYLDRLGEIVPAPGADELLRDLTYRDVALAILTNRGHSTRPLLDLLGWRGYFRAIVAADDDPEPKPAPDGMISILRELDVSADCAMMVGDSILDIRAAAAAGVRSCSVGGQPVPGSEIHFQSLSGVSDWLARGAPGPEPGQPFAL